jgi:predicted transcriptional regulator of viral defense system
MGIYIANMSANQQMRPMDFFDRHPVFRFDDFMAVHAEGGRRSRQTTASVLKQHVASGRLLHLRRGLYASVPRGADPARHPVDPYLLATQLAADGVVAYHAALQYHGKAYSLWSRFHYLTRGRQRRFVFRDQEFVPVQVPAAFRARPDLGGGIAEHRHAGGVVRVTTLERSLVDVLDAPDRSGGWEEVWRSLEMVEFFDLDAVLACTRARGSALTAARVGFFLEQHRDALMVEAHHLEAYRDLTPAQPRYLDSGREPGKLVKGWNLVVPERVLTRSWAEVS